VQGRLDLDAHSFHVSLLTTFVKDGRELDSTQNTSLGSSKMRKITTLAAAAILLASATGNLLAKDQPAVPSIAVGPQYDSTHVYVAPEDLDRFTTSLVATFGGTKSQPAAFTVTPTPSKTTFEFVFTPVGTFSVFGFTTPIPYPFGAERTGYLVTDMDQAVRSAKAHDADIVVATFPDPIGRDAIIEWPGGVHMQLYWHTTAPNYAKLQTVPENRVYVSPGRADAFIRDFVGFSGGKVTSDDAHAPGVEIGRPNDTYRRVRIESGFGKLTMLVTDGHLPYPFGHELTGYEVTDLAATLSKAKAAGATTVVEPYTADGRQAAIVAFPGGYVAEVHASASK
jgi:predicted enzyme related to lactoylglutathione lyase